MKTDHKTSITTTTIRGKIKYLWETAEKSAAVRPFLTSKRACVNYRAGLRILNEWHARQA